MKADEYTAPLCQVLYFDERDGTMATEDDTAAKEWHKKSAINLFNLVWELLDKEERTTDENDRMLHAAHASRFHWGEIGSPLEFERGEWQVSRVYSVLNRSEAAIHHARRCYAICKESGIGDFDIAFANEALARAYAVAGDAVKSSEYIRLGEKAGELIEDKDNREYFISELRRIADLSG